MAGKYFPPRGNGNGNGWRGRSRDGKGDGPPARYRWMKAKRGGNCYTCDAPIKPGDRIAWPVTEDGDGAPLDPWGANCEEHAGDAAPEREPKHESVIGERMVAALERIAAGLEAGLPVAFRPTAAEAALPVTAAERDAARDRRTAPARGR